jgi:NAD(P)-dependent dehydrogenase (short-subunit alcohol dehydrogenase family)
VAIGTGQGRLSGKVALVTGARGGLGAEICAILHSEGAQVAASDLDWVPNVPEGDYPGWSLDVTDEASVKSAVDDILGRFGRIDVLVNVAGITGDSKPSHEVTVEEFDRVISVNVKGTWLCTKHVIPAMIANRAGSIINISSISGLIGGSSLTIYHASKGAVRLLAKADAMVYAEYGIRVNSVHPGSIKTPMSEAVARNHPDGPEVYRARILASQPLQYRGEPSDIAYGVVYLASDESRFVTGTELVIDGGYTAQYEFSRR